MCGIAGMVSQERILPFERDLMLRANDLQAHRGPDGSGELSEAHAVLAMRRLSIIDLEGGWQPLFNEGRSLALVANGEVYNFVELRRELQSRGHCFATGSDCETILHLYEEHGLDCVDYLRGMYAFALWDKNRGRLLLARDRMGEKPLFLVEKQQQLFFASELKALVKAGLVPFKLAPSAVDAYFHCQYIPDPGTPLVGVRKLPAGHLLVVDLNPWRVREQCYWNMEDAPAIDGNPAELLRAELESVSALVVRSDVPVGVALSGGVDSSAVSALAARKYPGQLRAFCVGYAGDAESDEREDARQFAEYLRIPFHDVELALPDVVDFFPELQYWRDSPIADIAGQGYYAVMKLARQHDIRVMLQGQGGDELFWGYGWVRQAVARSLAKEQSVRDGTWKMPRAAPRRASWLRWVRRWRHQAESREHSIPLETPERMVFLDLAPDFVIAAGEVRDLYTSDWRSRLGDFRADGLFTFPHPWPQVDVRITRLICDTYLRENGITQGDRLSMASGVELRLPLLDHRLVETVIGLRKRQADHALAPKAWFKEALDGVVPAWVLQRRKRGFAPPVRQWHQALFARYGKYLDGGYLVSAGVLDARAARSLSAGPYPASAITPLSFKALVLEMWCRAMLNAAPTPLAAGSFGLHLPARNETSAASAVPADELAPVALFVYKRPEHTREALESLRRNALADKSSLYIFADAAKSPADADAVAAVRRLIREKPWCGRVQIVERDRNWGLSRSIIAGTTELVQRCGRVIVLEDDLMLAPGFLRYTNDALCRYADEPRVMQISGYLFPIESSTPEEAFLLPLTTSWGWATWKRAWQHFDAEDKEYDRLMSDPALRHRFDLQGAYPYSFMLQAQREARVDSWAIRWYLTTFLLQGLTLYPGASLVRNLGMDGSGTHCGRSDVPSPELWRGDVQNYPARITVDRKRFRQVITHLGAGKPTTWARRLWGRVRELVTAN